MLHKIVSSASFDYNHTLIEVKSIIPHRHPLGLTRSNVIRVT